MPLALQSLSSLTQDQYNAALLLLQTMLQEANPGTQVVGGPVDLLVVHPAAILEAANQVNINRVIQASSLLAITADPTLEDEADQSVVANLVSNYRISPLLAEGSTGQITIVLSALVSTVIGGTVVFTAPNGQTFTPTASWIGKTSSGAVINPTDALIQSIGNNLYAFTISAESVNTGVDGNIAAGTILTTTSTIANFVYAYATVSFTGGQNAETNTELLNRMQATWTNRTPATRLGLQGLLTAQPGYANIVAISTIGFGDPEEQRNHSILPVAIPGHVDCFVRVTGPVQTQLITVTATLVGLALSSTRGIWQVTLTRANAPIYQLQSIVLPQNAANPDAPSYAITITNQGYDLSGGNTPGTLFFPDIEAASEAAFSRYQTMIFTFIDTDTPASGGWVIGTTTASYVLTYSSMSGIAALQDVVAGRVVRSLVGDCLIRAPVPCFTTITINIDQEDGADAVDTTTVANAAVDAVNATGFANTLPAATILAAVNATLPAGSWVTSMSLAGTIVHPNGTTLSISGSTALSFTNDPTNVTTDNTVCFFASFASVTVNVTDVPGIS